MDTTKGRKWLCLYLSARGSWQVPGIVETTVYVVSGAIWPKRYPKRGGPKRVLEKGRKKRPPKEPKRAQKRPKRSPKAPQGAQKKPKKSPKGAKKRPESGSSLELLLEIGSYQMWVEISFKIRFINGSGKLSTRKLRKRKLRTSKLFLFRATSGRSIDR